MILKDFDLGVGVNSFYEKIETDSTASARQKQEGDYFDNHLSLILITTKEIKNLRPLMV